MTEPINAPISESSNEAAARRLLLVHAHPDDETTGTGATMARYASQGVPVCLVTGTRGEWGEVVADDLAQLRDAGPDALGEYRESELAAAMSELGVKRYVWLGGAGRWWDSGMVGTPENEHQRAFYRAELAEPVRALVEVLRRERPTVVVTYDPHGGYGHPDHIQAHRVTMAAITPAADPEYAPELGEPWQVPKVYWSVVPRSAVLKMAERVGAEFAEQTPGATDDMITARLDGEEYLPAKLAALRAYRSQVTRMMSSSPGSCGGHSSATNTSSWCTVSAVWRGRESRVGRTTCSPAWPDRRGGPVVTSTSGNSSASR